ncbi:TPA: hypothetical protein P7L42_003284 [Vibrio cholerae]|uniref:hypothetical protein n=1 Tax=Vibrio cholerae TaxID=666 RepID=UPI0013C086E5|nr:hypothetical protein [Vibrio cholerae]EGR0524897.1 hypothetical protein [Vibrio cholerae]EGR0600765.1 hypothetical protein [Vibrio cholerae]EJL6307356.1 hypothetical protein [Vibrio cholerae]EJL6419584.1 hypothetical protein [Vibrio cholerae]EJL6582339.1 hypothetical protein [Vibrio cholerae]
MIPIIIIGAAIIGSFGFAVEFFLLNDLIESGMIISKQDFYLKLLLTYMVLLIPPYIVISPSRSETAKMVGQATGLVILNIAQWISVGILIAIGFNAFN